MLRWLAPLLVSVVLAAACASPAFDPRRSLVPWGAEHCPDGSSLRSATRYGGDFARPGPARSCLLADGTHRGPKERLEDRGRFDWIELEFDEGLLVDADPVEEGP